VCSSGRLEYGSGRGTQEFLDVSSVIQHCPDLRLGEECYDEFSRTGLAYGPSFRSITRLHGGDGQALARLELSDDLRDSVHDWLLHPSLLDAALQTISGVVVGSEAPVEETVRPLYLPFRIGRIERYAALDDRMWVRAQRSTSAARSDQIRFDLDIADDQGRVLIVIRDFELRRVGVGVVGLVEDWVDCAQGVGVVVGVLVGVRRGSWGDDGCVLRTLSSSGAAPLCHLPLSTLLGASRA
jgi:polyketide synthase